MKWKRQVNYGANSSPAIGSDGTIYIGEMYINFYALNPDDGTIKWAFAPFSSNNAFYSSPAIGSDGTIYVGGRRYNLYALNPNGSFKWAFETSSERVDSSVAIGSDGTIYLGSEDNNLYAINPDGSQNWAFLIGAPAGSPAIGSDGTYMSDLEMILSMR